MALSIAIDGPVGAGKSTLARLCAEKLGFIYVDTGAFYRAIALFFIENSVDTENSDSVKTALSRIKLSIKRENGVQSVFVNGEDVSGKIRQPEISQAASKASALPAVREFLLDFQRDFAKTENIIMDGRDIGTVVLPNADLKLFISADPAERAKRRFDELAAKGLDISFNDVLRDLNERDERDRNRPIAPLKMAEDAVLIDTTGMDLAQSLEFVLDFIKGKLGL